MQLVQRSHCTQLHTAFSWLAREISIANLQHVILSMGLCSKHSAVIATAYT